MTFLASDFNLFIDYVDAVSSSGFTIPSETFTNGNLYVLTIGSTDSTAPAVPPNAPVTAGLTWTIVESEIYDVGAINNGTIVTYWAIPAGNTTSTTVITYNSTQTRMTAHAIEVTKPSEVIQTASGYGGGADIDITFADAVSSANLVISSFYTYSARKWIAGGGQVSLSSTTTNEYKFSQYNLGTYSVIPASLEGLLDKIGVAIEISETGSTPSTVTEEYTLNLTDDGLVTGAPIIHESTAGFASGVTVDLWPANVEGNAERASLVEAVSTAPTSTPKYNVTFTVAADNSAGDTVHFNYTNTSDGGAGDMKSVTGGIALESGTFDGTVAMVCP